MRVEAAHPSEFAWLVERTQCALTSDFRAIKAVDDAGNIRGMVGYCSFTPNSVQAHMAVDSPIAWRSLLRPAFEYPLEQLGLGVILGIIPEDNLRSVEMTQRLGFAESHRIKHGWSAGTDLIVFEMRRAGCRWLGREHREAAEAYG